jgi:hypothetical protein
MTATLQISFTENQPSVLLQMQRSEKQTVQGNSRTDNFGSITNSQTPGQTQIKHSDGGLFIFTETIKSITLDSSGQHLILQIERTINDKATASSTHYLLSSNGNRILVIDPKTGSSEGEIIQRAPKGYIEDGDFKAPVIAFFTKTP